MPFRLGLPAWAFPGWRGRYFEARPSPLASYARVFDVVEGNTTFHAIPDPATVAGWREAVATTDFRFCFKLPKTVTHAKRPAWDDLWHLLDVLAPLSPWLGPLLLQFPARVGPDQLPWLQRFFEMLPREHRYLLELRHPAFFPRSDALEELAGKFGLGAVTLDSRGLYAGPADHPEVAGALHEKPNLPVSPKVRANLACVRLVLHPDWREPQPYLDFWADQVAAWLRSEVEVIVTLHCPNNLHCPEFAALFHRALRARLGEDVLPQLAPWPVAAQPALF
ncbi:MAG: DUF72 domain-containing protein [Gammaproteobacteria bacterium]|nr:DUF72 domain-containing protein [Gammaproteobacteria bacterium]